MTKSIDTLVEDIHKLFLEGHECSPENVSQLGKSISETVAKRLKDITKKRDFSLYLSSIGKDPEDLWYEAHGYPKDEEFSPSALIKFLYGDILESVLLFLARESGHEVTDEQKEVWVDGVKGRMDAKIDGVVVDVKSASTKSFDKFKTGDLRKKDSFGYMWQLAGYSTAEDHIDGAFLAIDKQLGHITLMHVPSEELKTYDVPARIKMLREFIGKEEVPVHECTCELPDGKSGNMKLGVPCSYSSYKFHKHPGLQVYYYSNGPRFLTKVVREPRVNSYEEDIFPTRSDDDANKKETKNDE